MAMQNLPLQATSFVGREREIADIQLHLQSARLLTLTGPGGAGKTRLAIEGARRAAVQFADGVCFVPLAGLSSAASVAQALAAALGLQETGARLVEQVLPEYLAEKELLLVLDNCEHLVGACATMAEALLTQCAQLKLLATSREPLAIAWEMTWPVPPLSLDDDGVALFVARARAVRPAFEPSPAVGEICRRLDGLPLAIELAAARVRVLTPEQILNHLDDALSLLSGSSRTAPARQQTMRGAVEWSYNLLAEPERSLFRRLSVFSGGFTLEAAEAIAGDAALDLLTQLVDKSLVASEAARFRLLEPIRQYALERLKAHGEEPTARDRHLAHFARLCESAFEGLNHADQAAWLDRLEAEHDNIRTALEWSLEHAPLIGLGLAANINRYWWLRGRASEGRCWLELLLGRCPEPTETRAFGLFTYAGFAPENPLKLLEESYRIFTELGHKRGVAWAGLELADELHNQGGSDRIPGLRASSQQLFEELGERRGIAAMLPSAHRNEAGHERYEAEMEQRLEILRAEGDKTGVVDTLTQMAWADHYARAYDRAARRLQEAIELAQEIGDKHGLARAYQAKGEVAHRLGDYDHARDMYELSLERFREMGDERRITDTYYFLGRLALDTGHPVEARQLLGRVAAFARRTGSVQWVRNALVYMAMAHVQEKAFSEATRLIEEAIATARHQDYGGALSWCLRVQSIIAGEQGRYTEALRAQRESFANDVRDQAQRPGLALGLCMTGIWLIHGGTAEQGLRLIAAAEAAHPLQTALDYLERPYLAPALAAARAALGASGYDKVWAAGAAMPLEKASEEALGKHELPAGLTAREAEVVRLVAQGLSDREVAARLVISPRTVDTHLRNIFTKVGVDSRTALAAWALRNTV
jgi:predicted ATPase/DNA-binding CsgD family transcriptional regulator/sugar phosphate isomerase/epimerase